MCLSLLARVFAVDAAVKHGWAVVAPPMVPLMVPLMVPGPAAQRSLRMQIFTSLNHFRISFDHTAEKKMK